MFFSTASLSKYLMTTRPHFDDLSRRYREKDEVSEFQRLWAIFNHWLISYTGKKNDRACIEDIKSAPDLKAWIDKVVSTSASSRPHRIADGYAGSYPRFTSNNVISKLFRLAYKSAVVEPRINLPWRVGSESKVKVTNAITLTDEQFRSAYESHAQVLHEGIADFDLTIHQTLPALGVHSTGCCFFRGDIDISLPVNTSHYANRMLVRFQAKPELQELVNLAKSTNPTALSSDVMETLYNVRNVAVHGSLDFLNEHDNAAARAAYDALDSLVRHIRDNW